MSEYAAILATTGGETLSSLTSMELTSTPTLVVGGIIFFVWLVVFKLN